MLYHCAMVYHNLILNEHCMEDNYMQKRDYAWFLENYSDLFGKYGSAYLVIKNETVIGTYSSYAEGVKETSKTEPLGSFIVQKCDGSESAYTNYISSMNFI